MIEIFKALRQRYTATPALQSGLIGGFHLIRPLKQVMPYAVMIPLGGVPEYTTGDPYLEELQLQISYFGKTAEEIFPIERAWRDDLNGSGLALQEGRSLLMTLSNHNLLYEPADESGLAAFHYVHEYRILHQQARAV